MLMPCSDMVIRLCTCSIVLAKQKNCELNLLSLTLITPLHFVFLTQASSPLQVKYADGELERLGMTTLGVKNFLFSLFI